MPHRQTYTPAHKTKPLTRYPPLLGSPQRARRQPTNARASFELPARPARQRPAPERSAGSVSHGSSPEDPDLPAFYFDPLLHPISAYRSGVGAGGIKPAATQDIHSVGEVSAAVLEAMGLPLGFGGPSASSVSTPNDFEDDLLLSKEFSPCLHSFPLSGPNTAAGISLYFAPPPFNVRSGLMRRVMDVPLVKSWYQERASHGLPVKVRVSYQKLLKAWVLNKKEH